MWSFPMMTRTAVLVPFLLSLFSFVAVAQETYEYIVVGSGPGGGPLAANLARNGHSVLLLEAGDDQGDNVNTTILGNFAAADNDPATRWDFFVKHFSDPERESQYKHMTWRNPDGSFYVGLDPPQDAEQLGIWYPRAGTLGGCAMHNAGVVTLPNDRDWDDIATLTGDDSWSASNMRKYFVNLEDCLYEPEGTPGHGFDGYIKTSMGDASWTQNKSDIQTLAELAAIGSGAAAEDLPMLLQRDINALDPQRDTSTGLFGAVSHSDNRGYRSSPNNYIRATLNDSVANYPLTLQLNTLVTKILFSENGGNPTATGVEFLQGEDLYGADPHYDPKVKGTTGQAFASKEVIIAGGVFNTPQILKLSGIGPRDELESLDIPVVADLPGVGHNMADNYEDGIIGLAARDIIPPFGGMFYNFLQTSTAKNNVRDIHMFCGAFSFEGFWPGFPTNYGPSQYECAIVHMGPRSQAGSVTLRSTDPREMPDINFRFFEHGAEEDLQALYEAVKWVRENIFDKAPDGIGPIDELHPCTSENEDECTAEQQKEYLALQAYSHHATSSCRIGADDDESAVLDSKFRVRGVQRLRIVDGSAFPTVPGSFPVIPTIMLAEKATEDILADAA